MDDGSLGRHGLGSSSSWLDGVPFKIGPKFRPPPKVIYQPVIESSSQFSKDEYSFETEEAVLAWAQAREEALKKAAAEQAEKASKNNSNATKNEEVGQPDREAKGGTDDSGGEHGINSVASSTAMNAGQDNSVKGEKMLPPPVPTKPLIPKKLHEPGAILKPTPIQHSNKITNQNGNSDETKSLSNSVVDVSMFESVADPFDTLELQTINDMEELKVLLDTASSSNSLEKDDSQQQNQSLNNKQTSESTEGIYDLAAPVSMDNWVKFEDSTSSNADKMPNDVNKLQETHTRSSESPASDDIGEYVDIADEGFLNPGSLIGAPSSKMTMPGPTLPHSAALPGSDMPKLDSAKGIYKPVLPPIPNNQLKTLNGECVSSHSLEQNNDAPHPNSTTAAVSMSASALSVSFSNQTISPPNPPCTKTKPEYSKPARVAPLPPAKPNRPATTPSPRNTGQSSSPRQPLTNSIDINSNPSEQVLSNPYSRHSTNHSPQVNEPPQLPMTQLNRYSPLPPPPFPKPKEVGLTDPYHGLSHESREFVDRVTSMGFLRAKVARAVEKFGQDEKEVLDHLFAVDMLVEKKYAPIHAEAALQSCKNDLEKAEDFLKLQAQLEQLGFSSETVRDALVSSNMDHDKALDILTA